MNSVTVRVEDLLESLKENKKKHDKILRQAIAGYWKKCRECLTDARQGVKDKDPSWQQALYEVRSVPEDHSDDYDSAIAMLEMCSSEEIEISRQDFESYVRNRWHWRESFLVLNSSYCGPTGPTGSTGPTGPAGLDF
jgi:hypothetical protein